MPVKTVILPKLMPRDIAICNLVDTLEDLPISEGFKVEIHEHAATRSEKQNNCLWWIYGEILKLGGNVMAGWDKDDLHEFFLGEHFGTVTKTVFGRKRRTPIRRSKSLSKTHFAELVDFIYRFMANEGVVLPEPDPDYKVRRHREQEREAEAA